MSRLQQEGLSYQEQHPLSDSFFTLASIDSSTVENAGLEIQAYAALRRAFSVFENAEALQLQLLTWTEKAVLTGRPPAWGLTRKAEIAMPSLPSMMLQFCAEVSHAKQFSTLRRQSDSRLVFFLRLYYTYALKGVCTARGGCIWIVACQ